MADKGGMIDVSSKDITVRTAKACGTIILSQEAFEVVKNGSCIKGDVLATAKIAAINAVKSTPSVIPMCHTVLIEAVDVNFEMKEQSNEVTVYVAVKSSGKTGVEMEALCGVSAGCLSIYDMLKYTGKEMTITQVKLLEKTGGKSVDYKRDN